MEHLHVVSRLSPTPARAASLLEKTVLLSNALEAVAMVEEISDVLSKEDTGDN